MRPWEIPGKVGEFKDNWRVVTLYIWLRVSTLEVLEIEVAISTSVVIDSTHCTYLWIYGIGVGAQSTLGGCKIFALKICIKSQQNARILHDSCLKNYQNTWIFMIFARKIYNIPAFYMIFARKMPKFYIIIAKKYFCFIFFYIIIAQKYFPPSP